MKETERKTEGRKRYVLAQFCDSVFIQKVIQVTDPGYISCVFPGSLLRGLSSLSFQPLSSIPQTSIIRPSRCIRKNSPFLLYLDIKKCIFWTRQHYFAWGKLVQFLVQHIVGLSPGLILEHGAGVILEHFRVWSSFPFTPLNVNFSNLYLITFTHISLFHVTSINFLFVTNLFKDKSCICFAYHSVQHLKSIIYAHLINYKWTQLSKIALVTIVTRSIYCFFLSWCNALAYQL